MIEHLLNKLSTLSLWKIHVLSFILGAIAAFALPPVYWIPLCFLSFPGLLILWRLPQFKTWKQHFLLGWSFGLGHFTVGLYWISYAFHVDLMSYLWLVPLTVFGLPAYLALYTGLTTLSLRLLNPSPINQILLFSIAWTFFEWARGFIFTGFPWNLMGYVWMPFNSILQISAYGGIYSLSFMSILLFTISTLFISNKNHKQTFSLTGIVILAWVGLALLGQHRLETHPTQFHEKAVIRIVQPSIPQIEKWDRTYMREHFFKLVELSKKPSNLPLTHILWPESAVIFPLETAETPRKTLAALTPKNGLTLVGTPRITYKNDDNSPQVWNSLLVLNHQNEILAKYDKAHLVPFGEFIPLRSWLPFGIDKVTAGTIDYSSGSGVQTLKPTADLPSFSPLICYEGIFPGKVVAKNEVRPEWLLNITNDGWYGDTFGPHQHFAINRVRAIEEGLPLVRVANNGISGVIDAYGRVIATLSHNVVDVLDVPLPQSQHSPTLYSQYGNLIILFFLGIIMIVLLVFNFCPRMRIVSPT